MSAAEQSAEKDSMLTLDEHDRWMQAIEHDGWGDVAADKVYARAVEAVAWELIEQTMDTSDGWPTNDTVRDAHLTAHRLLGALRSGPPGAQS